MNDDELAAIAAAVAALFHPEAAAAGEPRTARWKLADRHPDLELEDIRALH